MDPSQSTGCIHSRGIHGHLWCIFFNKIVSDSLPNKDNILIRELHGPLPDGLFRGHPFSSMCPFILLYLHICHIAS